MDLDRQKVPSWIITFADLMSILICFFVLLLSFTDIDGDKFTDAAWSLSTTFKSTNNSHTNKVVKQHEIVKNALQREIQQKLIGLDIKNNRISIILLQKLAFTSGQAKLAPEVKPLLRKIAVMLENVKGAVKVEGFTDQEPITNQEFMSNWELSSMRAFNVANELFANKNLDPKRFMLIGHGANKPLAPGNDEASKAQNRRVEINITVPLS